MGECPAGYSDAMSQASDDKSGSAFRRELGRFDPSVPVESASTPPSSWYTDPAFHDAEARTVFRNSWQIVGRVDQVSERGDYFTGDLAGEPYVVLRDDAGELAAFSNVCRHHAAQVACGEGISVTVTSRSEDFGKRSRR